MQTFKYTFPELGEGLHEGEIIKILIKPGDTVTDENIIMEVQNDKAVVEVPCPVNGVVKEVLVKDGQVCHVGQVVAIIDAEGDLPDQDDVLAGAQTEQEVDSVRGSADVEAIYKPSSNTNKQLPEPEHVPPNNIHGTVAITTTKDVLATPSVRKFAREQGIDITQIIGTGNHGKITKEDVLGFHRQSSASSPPQQQVENTKSQEKTVSAPSVHFEEERIAFKGIRKLISSAMVTSAYTAPHVTIMDEVDVTELVAFRLRMKPIAEKKGIKLTYLPFIVKALVAACRQFPALNAMIDEVANEIIYKKYYNIGIAVDTEQGLVVPIIKQADRKSVWMIAEHITDLAVRGRSGKLTPEEMKGSTISITNIGSAGGMFFTPIINFPEVAILGTGRISEKAIVKNGEIVAAPVMALSLSFDHRIIDGATAQNFVNYIKQLLANPELLVMEV